jgi:hypothetical protein
MTALITETTSVLLVKWLSPSSPLSCCRPMTMAAPAMNPTMAACDRKSTKNPSLGRDEAARYRHVKTCSWLDVEQKQSIFAAGEWVHAPEQPEGDLEDACEEGDSEDERPVRHRVRGRVDDVLDHRRQQQRDHSYGADGDLPRRPHDSVDQRWHDARVFRFVRPRKSSNCSDKCGNRMEQKKKTARTFCLNPFVLGSLTMNDTYKGRIEGPVWQDWRIQCSATSYPKKSHVNHRRDNSARLRMSIQCLEAYASNQLISLPW